MGILDKVNNGIGEATSPITDAASKASQLVYGKGGIDALRAGIQKHGGVAKQNRFQTIFTPPSQTLLNKNSQEVIGGVISGNFDIKQLVNDPRDISLLTTRAAFPSWNIATFDYQSSGQVDKFPYTFIHEDLTLSFLVTNDYYIKKMFDTWMNGIINISSHTTSYKGDYTTDIVVAQLNAQHIPVYSYKFTKAFPVIMTAMEFDQGSTDLVKFDVTFAYDIFEPEGMLDTNKAMVSNGFGKLNIGNGQTLSQKAGSTIQSMKSSKYNPFK